MPKAKSDRSRLEGEPQSETAQTTTSLEACRVHLIRLEDELIGHRDQARVCHLACLGLDQVDTRDEMTEAVAGALSELARGIDRTCAYVDELRASLTVGG